MKLFRRIFLLVACVSFLISGFLFFKSNLSPLSARSRHDTISVLSPDSDGDDFLATAMVRSADRLREKTGGSRTTTTTTKTEHAANNDNNNSNNTTKSRSSLKKATAKKKGAPRRPKTKRPLAEEKKVEEAAVRRSPYNASLATTSSTTTTTNYNSSGSDRWVVFVCDGRRSCGGWGDRQRGLTGVYLLAEVTGRRFALVFTRPCALTNHYVPNLVPWDVAPETLRAAGRGSNVTLDDVNSKQRLTFRLRTMDFNAVYPQRVVYIRTNAEYWLGIRASRLYRLPDWARGSRPRYFAAAWTRLMKPSPSLQAVLDAFLDKIRFRQRERPLVCAHVRVGRSGTLRRDTGVRYNITKLPVLWTFLQGWVNNGSHIFLATDNYEVRNRTRIRFGDWMIDNGEQIVHVDQGRAAGVCHGFQSALLDQLILSHCDVLVTSHSIFSQRASYLRGRSDNLFTLLPGAVVKIGL